jgi:hypothetical protein
MPKPTDDYEAVRLVVAAIEGFDPTAQERIIRWAREKVGLAGPAPVLANVPAAKPPSGEVSGASQSSTAKDLKTFIGEKKPNSDVQFAASVAYFYRFEAPAQERKTEINSEVLQEACRLANRERLKLPSQTLRNAHHLGLLDKGSSTGMFSINSVGENLVAMTLPRKGSEESPAKRARHKKKTAPKKTGHPKPK